MTGADWGAATDTGLRRTHNEDRYLAGPTVFAVADGMGGRRGGGAASEIAVGVLQALSQTPLIRTDDINDAIGQAHERILARASDRPEHTAIYQQVTGRPAGRRR